MNGNGRQDKIRSFMNTISVWQIRTYGNKNYKQIPFDQNEVSLNSLNFISTHFFHQLFKQTSFSQNPPIFMKETRVFFISENWKEKAWFPKKILVKKVTLYIQEKREILVNFFHKTTHRKREIIWRNDLRIYAKPCIYRNHKVAERKNFCPLSDIFLWLWTSGFSVFVQSGAI